MIKASEPSFAWFHRLFSGGNERATRSRDHPRPQGGVEGKDIICRTEVRQLGTEEGGRGKTDTFQEIYLDKKRKEICSGCKMLAGRGDAVLGNILAGFM